MCGIVGIHAYADAAEPIDRVELEHIRDHMTTRGPDGAGTWVSDNARIGLAHRRLAIIDLSKRAAQPMASADHRFVITYNGEIYNHKTLKKQLEARGAVFRSTSDTEVLLHLYSEMGEDMLKQLRGMFAFGIWDDVRGALMLARDPYGIKPLYYAENAGTLRFASSVKALLTGGSISRDQEPAGWVGFYLFGHVPEPWTTYRDIRSVPAGSALLVDETGLHVPRKYVSITQLWREAEEERHPVGTSGDSADDVAVVREALLDSVRHHLVADVPVGAFLSAGVDSGALVGLMRDAGQDEIQTVTLTFEEFRGTRQDEAPLAAQVAAQYETRHTDRVVTQTEFHSDLPKILEVMDQPTIDGVNMWFVSKAARELGLKVAVSGLGGDELFGGYPSFRDIPRWVRLLALPSRIPFSADAFSILARSLIFFRPQTNRKLASLLDLGGCWAGAYLLRRGVYMPKDLDDILDPDLLQEGLRRLAPLKHIDNVMKPRLQTNFAKVAVLESSLYMRNQLLRDTDWAAMAHSLEVRVPLVDTSLLQRLAPIMIAAGTENGKDYLAKSPAQPLPRKVMHRPKTGFGVPVGRWCRDVSGKHKSAGSRLPGSKDQGWARAWACEVAARQ